MILANEELYLYSFLNLAAEVGGYVGLLLGVSLLQLSEVGSRITGKIGANFYRIDTDETNTDKAE